MTLHTRIAVTTPGIDPHAAFEQLTTLIGATPKQTAEATDESPNPDSPYPWERDRPHSRTMPLGLGLPALVWVDYSPDGKPLAMGGSNTTSVDEALQDEDKTYSPRAHLMIHADTAYAYAAPNGAGCGDLHAWIVREMGAWLTQQGASWDWYDESGWGWREEWKTRIEELASEPNFSREWGTLGDPDVGALGSMIPSVTQDSRQSFLREQVLPAVMERYGHDLSGR